MRVLFRADAGLQIGTGHVMRCITLANELRARGAEATFVTRTHTGHAIAAVEAAGHRVVPLDGSTGHPYGAHPAPPAHATWLDADWRLDAAQTRAALQETGAHWLVMDHYALDRAWQDAAMPERVRLLVIDDLADRPHRADILLDQNFGREAADYYGLVPATCDLRIGPNYALLRPDFARLRPIALKRRAAMERPQWLMVTLGGIDKYNASGQVLDALALSPLAIGLKVTVVLGENAPHLASVRAQAKNMPMHTEVAVNVSDMADRMLLADLCIGAAGSTTWERCALGLPTLQLVLADNQVALAHKMTAVGLAMELPAPIAPEFTAALAGGLDHLFKAGAYRAMARRVAEITDGYGAARIAAHLLEPPQELKALHA